VYNDAEAISRCLEKLHKMGVKALVVDGRFEDFPAINDSDISTDNTQEVCQHFHAHYEVFPVGREQDKFNFALNIAEQLGYKVFMYCGADAWFEADMPEFLLSLQLKYERYITEPTQITVQTEELQPDAKWNNTATRQPRVILNYWKMEARHLHWTMYEKGAHDTRPLSPMHDGVLEGIKLYHDNTIRPTERDDMMTNYQNHNVERERQMFLDKVVPKAYKYLKIMVHNMADGSYEEARDRFLRSDGKFSHLMIVDEGYDPNFEQMHGFERVLRERNNMMQQLPIVTAVWASKTTKNHFTLNPDGEIKSKWPKYPRIEALYSPKGLPVEPEPILVAPYTPGPAVCMNRRVVAMVEHRGDKLDFLAILMGLGYQMHADSRIQF
jgi:hypothetical protein